MDAVATLNGVASEGKIEEIDEKWQPMIQIIKESKIFMEQSLADGCSIPLIQHIECPYDLSK